MRVFLSLFAFMLVFSASVAFASWKYNPFTGKLDYYEDLSDSGVTVPMSYIASPTAENLRDALIAAGLMDAAPAIVSHGEVFENTTPEVFSDVGNEVWQDYVE